MPLWTSSLCSPLCTDASAHLQSVTLLGDSAALVCAPQFWNILHTLQLRTGRLSATQPVLQVPSFPSKGLAKKGGLVRQGRLSCRP